MGQWDRGFLSQCFTCLTCLRGSSEGPAGRAELVLLVSRKFSGRSGGRAPASPPSLSHLSQCLRGVLWGSGAGRLPARRGCLSVSLVSRRVLQRANLPTVSVVSLVSRAGPLGFGRRPTARRACLTCLNVSGGSSGVRGAGRLPARRGCLRCLACLAGGSSGVRGAASDSPPSLSHLSRGASSGLRRACLSCLTCLRGVRPLGRGLARGFTQKCRQFFRDFSMFCWLDFA